MGDEKITFAMCHFANYFRSDPPECGNRRATARALADAGTRVIIRYERNATQASTLLTEIRAAGDLAESVAADLMAPACQTGPRGSSCNG